MSSLRSLGSLALCAALAAACRARHRDVPFVPAADAAQPVVVHFPADAPRATVGPAVPYTSFEGQAVTRFPWLGRNVAYLTPTRDLDPRVMARLLDVTDRTWDFYRDMTGDVPATDPAYQLQGRATIAVVGPTCGAGCGHFARTGIEFLPVWFDELYRGVAERDEFSHLPFYELGRNFWLYGSTLDYQPPEFAGTVNTGYAVTMRFLAIEATGARGGPWTPPWGRYEYAPWRASTEAFLDAYLADPAFTWQNTMAVGSQPPHPMRFSYADLWAASLLRLRRDHGGNDFVRRFLREARLRYHAGNTQMALQNFAFAASAAAGTDLCATIRTTWRWPLAPEADAQCAEMAAHPTPWPLPVEPPPAARAEAPPAQRGLRASFFANPDLAGTPALTRVDPALDFDWGTGPAWPGQAGSFSARWEGTLTPHVTGRHALFIACDDGARVFLDDRLVIEAWSDHALLDFPSGPLELVAGRAYRLRVEYYQRAGGAGAHLAWASLAFPRRPLEASALGH